MQFKMEIMSNLTSYQQKSDLVSLRKVSTMSFVHLLALNWIEKCTSLFILVELFMN